MWMVINVVLILAVTIFLIAVLCLRNRVDALYKKVRNLQYRLDQTQGLAPLDHAYCRHTLRSVDGSGNVIQETLLGPKQSG